VAGIHNQSHILLAFFAVADGCRRQTFLDSGSGSGSELYICIVCTYSPRLRNVELESEPDGDSRLHTCMFAWGSTHGLMLALFLVSTKYQVRKGRIGRGSFELEGGRGRPVK